MLPLSSSAVPSARLKLTLVENKAKRRVTRASAAPSGVDSSKRSKPIPIGSSTCSNGVPSASKMSSERLPAMRRASPPPVVVTWPTTRSPAPSRMSKSLDMKPVICCSTRASWLSSADGATGVAMRPVCQVPERYRGHHDRYERARPARGPGHLPALAAARPPAAGGLPRRGRCARPGRPPDHGVPPDEGGWALEECEPVRGVPDPARPPLLPGTPLGPGIVVRPLDPSPAQVVRFTEAGGEPRERRSAAASACGTGGAPMPTEASGFAAQLLGGAPTPPRPSGGPDIGGRRNLMGGDVGQGLPSSEPDDSQD